MSYCGKFREIMGYEEQEVKAVIMKAKSNPELFTNLELVLLKTLYDMVK